jgi:hypothetical protein
MLAKKEAFRVKTVEIPGRPARPTKVEATHAPLDRVQMRPNNVRKYITCRPLLTSFTSRVAREKRHRQISLHCAPTA